MVECSCFSPNKKSAFMILLMVWPTNYEYKFVKRCTMTSKYLSVTCKKYFTPPARFKIIWSLPPPRAPQTGVHNTPKSKHMCTLNTHTWQISINNNKLDKFEKIQLCMINYNHIDITLDCIIFYVFVTKSNINCKYR